MYITTLISGHGYYNRIHIYAFYFPSMHNSLLTKLVLIIILINILT